MYVCAIHEYVKTNECHWVRCCGERKTHLGISMKSTIIGEGSVLGSRMDWKLGNHSNRTRLACHHGFYRVHQKLHHCSRRHGDRNVGDTARNNVLQWTGQEPTQPKMSSFCSPCRLLTLNFGLCQVGDFRALFIADRHVTWQGGSVTPMTSLTTESRSTSCKFYFKNNKLSLVWLDCRYKVIRVASSVDIN